MLKLYDVVFGQKEFEKTKIDVRFDIIESLLHTLSITSLEDFEYLESCLYKIKDQLRVKSSNLNKVIRDPQKALSKKKVLRVVEHLLSLRNTFLNNAFSALIKENPSQFESQNSLNDEEVGNVSKKVPSSDEISPQKSVEVNTSNSNKKNSNTLSTTEHDFFTINPILFENNSYSIVFITTTSPYIRVNFKEEIDLVVVRNISSLLFDVYQAHGTTIIIEQQRALIVPRTIDDTVLETLPQNREIDVNLIEQKLLSFFKTIKNDVQEAKYVEITDDNKIRPQSNQQKEDSLDSLLNSIEEKKQDPTPKPKPKNDSSKITVEKDLESIEIEKAPQKVFDDEITIITKDEEVNTPNTTEVPIEKKVLENLPKHIIYQDDQLIVYLNPQSQAFGEILIKHTSQKNYFELNESELSYISIFTKIFSSLLFDTLQAHGTNIFWSSNENILHIVPRVQDDSLNFQWEPQKHSDEFLEQIKNKLFLAMSNVSGKDSQTSQKNNKSKQTVQKVPQTDVDLKQKAQNVLEALRKIP